MPEPRRGRPCATIPPLSTGPGPPFFRSARALLEDPRVNRFPGVDYVDFDSLLSSIELTKEILEQTAPVFNNLELSERSPVAPARPPVAQRQ